MKAALKDAVKRIKEAGFSYIKVELEGDIGRDGERECDNCYGEGSEDCSYCGGEGFVDSGRSTLLSGESVLEECSECYGDGRVNCDNCDGQGNCGSYMDESTCEEFMKSCVPSEVLGRLVYGSFYEDGSVDSEFTFTVKVEDVEDVIHWIEAFKALAEECSDSSGIDVSGAGMHIAVLPTESNGVYPVRNYAMPRAKVRNFTSEITKLMPALFFLASADHHSRDLGYRRPRVGEDKYNAVSTQDDTCYEFRVFETCYDKPEAFFDYVQTIANCLKFHADPTLKVKALGKQFGFNDGDIVARFFETPEQLRILNATVKHIKPTDKTLKKLKQERGIHYTMKSLTIKEKKERARLHADYLEYARKQREIFNTPLTEDQQAKIDWYMTQHGFNRDSAEREVRGYSGHVMGSFAEFLRHNMPLMDFGETLAV